MEGQSLQDILDTVQVGCGRAIDVVDALDGNGKRLEGCKRLEIHSRLLQPEPTPEPRLAATESRAHVFFDIEGFAAYLVKYGKADLVVCADPTSQVVSAILDESKEKGGAEVVTFQPQKHPLWAPWEKMIGCVLPLDNFIQHIRMNRRSIIKPDSRSLILDLGQIEARVECVLSRGSGTKSVNGMMVTTNIQGTRKQDLVELPDEITLSVPLYVATSPEEILVDLVLAAKGEEIVVQMSTGDLETARVRVFQGMIQELKTKLNDKGTFTLGRPAWASWRYLPK